MAASTSDNGEEMISGINVTPLVDIFLVLLIIFMLFMVSATYIIRSTLEVELPRAAHGGEGVPTLVNIVLDKQGQVFVDGAPTSDEELKARVREALAKDKDARVIISADKAATHGAVVTIIDTVKGEGIAKFAINIEKDLTATKATP